MIRVAQLVYDCTPDAGSDPGIGWHAVVSASGAGMVVHAITKSSNRDAIEAVASPPNVHWHYIDVPEEIGPFSTGTSKGDAVHLLRWLSEARKLCASLAEMGEIDLTHFVTFSAYWAPVPFADLPIPHVFGPVGGGERVAPELESTRMDRISASARSTVQNSFTRSSTWRKLMSQPDTVVIAASRATAHRLETLGARVFETGATGCLTDSLIAKLDAIEPITEAGTTLIASGRQLRWKGHDLAIKAMPTVLAQHEDATLELLGSGPAHEDLRALVNELGISKNVIFRRGIDRIEERRRIAGADCFVFPSRRDTGSTLIPLVQVLGVPIAAFDTGALPDSTGGFAQLADPRKRPSPSTTLGTKMLDALQSTSELLDQARHHAIKRHGEAAAQASLTRWYEHALSSS